MPLSKEEYEAIISDNTKVVAGDIDRDSPYWESSGSKGNLNEMVAS